MSESNANIDALVDKLLEAAQSERNTARRGHFPSFSVGLEELIVWAKLFSLDIDRFYTDPAYYVEQTLRHKLWAFGNIDDESLIDTAVNAYLGHYPEYTYLGMSVKFNREGVPTLSAHPGLSAGGGLSSLEPVEFGRTGWMPRQLEWFERISGILGGRLRVRFQTWWRGCLDLGIQMCGYDEFMTASVERPEFVHGLLHFITTQRIDWFEAYRKHFNADMPAANIGDDWLNVPFISPDFFAGFVLPQYLRLEAAQGGMGGIHSCGNQASLQKHMLKLKTLRGFEVSPWTSLEDSLANLPPDKNLGIALHPNDVLYTDAAAIEAKVRRIISLCEGRRYSIGTGGLTPVAERGAEADYIKRIRTYTDAFRRARG